MTFLSCTPVTVEAWVKPTGLSNRYGVFSTRSANAAGSFQFEVGCGGGVIGTNSGRLA